MAMSWRMRSNLRAPIIVLAHAARRRMPQPWFRVVVAWNGDALEIAVAQPASWRWDPCRLPVSCGGVDGEVVGRFENRNGRFKAVRTEAGFAVVLDDLPPRADGC